MESARASVCCAGFIGAVRDLVASLSHTGALTREDLDELRDFLDEQGRDER